MIYLALTLLVTKQKCDQSCNMTWYFQYAHYTIKLYQKRSLLMLQNNTIYNTLKSNIIIVFLHSIFIISHQYIETLEPPKFIEYFKISQLFKYIFKLP